MLTNMLKRGTRWLLRGILGCLVILSGTTGKAQQTTCTECRQILEEMARQTAVAPQQGAQKPPDDVCPDCREVFRQLAEATKPKIVARPDVYSVSEGASLVINPPGVLGNDVCPKGAACTVKLGTQRPQNGDLTAFNPNGSFSYTGRAGGTERFTYALIVDGTVSGEEGMVTVKVREPRLLRVVKRLKGPVRKTVGSDNGNIKKTEKADSGSVGISIEVHQESGTQE